MKYNDYIGKPQFHDLTVFVISSGEETETDCMAALNAQDCVFRVEHIRDVAPMSAAFQAMSDRCKTPFFVQIDADMILKPDAVQRLYVAIRQSPFWVYRIAGTLYEEGFGIGGAVKCWKRSLLRFVKFHDCRTVDRDLHNRLRWFGLRSKCMEDILGVHRSRYSEFSFYLKTKSDIEKWRFLKRPASHLALPLMNDILDNDIDAYRLLGALLGSLTGPERLMKSKDLPLEKKRLSKILELLGHNEALRNLSVGSIERDYLCTTFSSVFNDFRGDGSDKRKSLVKIIVDIYAVEGMSFDYFTNNLLEIVDQ